MLVQSGWVEKCRVMAEVGGPPWPGYFTMLPPRSAPPVRPGQSVQQCCPEHSCLLLSHSPLHPGGHGDPTDVTPSCVKLISTQPLVEPAGPHPGLLRQ